MSSRSPLAGRFAFLRGSGHVLLVMGALAALALLASAPGLAHSGTAMRPAPWILALVGIIGLRLMLEQFGRRLQGLASSRDTLQRLTESPPGSIFRLDREGRFTPEIKSIGLTGYPEAELVGRHFTELLIPDDRDRIRAEFDATLRGEAKLMEAAVLRRDGRTVEVAITALPLVVRSQVIGVHGVALDISERKRMEHDLRASELCARNVFETALDGILLLGPDERIEAANPAACRIAGRDPDELVHRRLQDLVEPAQAGEIARLSEQRRHTGHARGELWIRRADGVRLRIEYASARFTDASGDERASIMFRDVTDREHTQQQLRLAASALAHTGEGVAIVDRRWRIVSVNQGFTRIAGVAPGEVLGKRPRIEFSDQQIASLRGIRHQIRRTGFWQGEALKHRRDGSEVPVLISISPVCDEHGRVSHFVLVFNDISEHKDYERRLQHLAHHDLQTDLPNRFLLEERVRQSIARARRYGRRMALLFVDMDRFKTVNDSLGHAAGDELLRSVAERLAAAVREVDTVARLGGDEFGILLGELAEAADAEVVARRILDALSKPFVVTGHTVFVGASIGIACHPQDGTDFDTLLQNGDVAMYRAKAQGRNRYEFYAADMNAEALRTLALQSNLHQALANDELEVHYQPQVDLESGSVSGAEALLRWHSAELGEVSPAEFIPLAEETGLIVPIGEWVLRQACAHLRTLHASGHPELRVAVNLSARQFARFDLVRRIASILQETGLEARYLELEITETTVMHSVRDAIEAMRGLSELGVSIALDDFGTGYSSLQYLQDFPLNSLKIDKSFVSGLPADPGSAAITRTVIGMAESLGIGVVAEGIETPAQLATLRDWGCGQGQGYLLGRPVSAAQFRRRLETSEDPRLATT